MQVFHISTVLNSNHLEMHTLPLLQFTWITTGDFTLNLFILNVTLILQYELHTVKIWLLVVKYSIFILVACTGNLVMIEHVNTIPCIPDRVICEVN